MVLRSVVIFSILITIVQSAASGQRESESHGNRAPSEKFQDQHYAGGEHNDDLDHQAILGSKKDAEEFDQLKPEESKRRLKILAKKMDTNGDGYVSRDELTDWIHKSMISLDGEETEERFTDVDANKDGLIIWKEYAMDAFGDEDEEEKISTDPEDLKLMREDETYFKAADKNHDEKLDRSEFAAFQNPENHEHMHEALIESTLAEKDADKDGLIDFKEFMGDVAENPSSEWYLVEKERFENEYDKNKDGVLDRKEMNAWLIPVMKQTSKEEMEHLFDEADKNKDDRLDYDEIVNEHQLFVGSEATNYGEHLDKIRDEL